MTSTNTTHSWPMMPLAETCEINPRLPEKPKPETEVSFLPMESVTSDGKVVSPQTRTFEQVKSGFTLFKKEDVLVAKITPCFENHKSAQALINTEYGAGSTEFHVFRAREICDPRFLFWFLRQSSLYETGAGFMRGSSGHRRIPQWFFENLEIPLPSLDEQRRIAGILDGVQNHQADVSKQLKLVAEIKSAFFTDLKAQGASIKNLGELLLEKPKYGLGASGIPFSHDKGRYIRITDIKDSGQLTSAPVSPSGEISDLPPENLLHPRDILIARSGATVGKSYIHEESEVNHWYAGYLIRFRIDEEQVPAKYVFDYLHSNQYWSWISQNTRTVAQPNINAKAYSSLPVPIPSKEMLSSYLERRERLSKLENALLKKQTLLTELQKSLSTRAFQGEL